MGNFYYAQLDENNVCIGLSYLSGEIEEYHYHTLGIFNPITEETEYGEPQFISRMILIPVYSESYIGLRYNSQGKWEQVSD